MSDRYSNEDPLFDKEHGILKNRLGILDPQCLYSLEIEHLLKAYATAASEYPDDHVFTEADVCRLHKLFLGEIYDWAGTYRSVDLSSENIRYCHAAYLPENMRTFGSRLASVTPLSRNMPLEKVLETISQLHAELVILHPFRDGNGRLTRLLCDLLLMQAGARPMNTAAFYSENFVRKYHEAIQRAWHSGDYSELLSLLAPLVTR